VELLTPLRGRQQAGITTAALLARDGSIDWLWPRCVPSRPCWAMRINEISVWFALDKTVTDERHARYSS